MTRVLFYVDGSAEGTTRNPGPMGAGIVVVRDTRTEEHAVPLGLGTNQVAELLAVGAALMLVPEAERSGTAALVKTDSRYAIGCLTERWNVVANREIVSSLRALVAGFAEFRMEHVPGHAGVSLNERAHQLAKAARLRARSGEVAPPPVIEAVAPAARVELEHAREVIAHLASALQFYADPLTYLAPPGEDDAAPSIVDDRGRTARATLMQLGFHAVADPFAVKEGRGSVDRMGCVTEETRLLRG